MLPSTPRSGPLSRRVTGNGWIWGWADSLLASLDGIADLRAVLPDGLEAIVDYDDDPFGVQYWVMRWQW